MDQQHISVSGDTGRIRLPHRFDVTSTLDFRIPFVRLLADTQARKLVVDFSRLDYIDSMGIGMLIAWRKTSTERGKALVLEKCNSKVVNLFKMVGVERLFEFA